jgi:hypothetical protein
MGDTAWQGPLISFGVAPFGDSNGQLGPNAWYQGDMILDPRANWTYQPDNPSNRGIYGWPTIGSIPILDCVPATLSASNIASATPSSGTALTLATSSVAGVTVGCTIQNVNGQSVSGLLGLDVSTTRTVTGTFTNASPKITFTGVTMLGVQVNDQVTLTSTGTLPAPFALLTTYYVNAIGSLHMMLSATPGGPPISATTAGSGTQTINVTAPGTYYPPGLSTSQYNAGIPYQPPVIFGMGAGSGGPIRYWNPSWAFSRGIGVTSNADDTQGTYTIKGYDIYGEPMTQTITGLSTGQAVTTKAFKYIASVTPNGTINSTTLTVGTTDVWGLPLRADMLSYLQVAWGALPPPIIVTASVTFVAADVTTPTALTGDVRGTVYGGSASDGTKRLLVTWNALSANMSSRVGLIGQPQF